MKEDRLIKLLDQQQELIKLVNALTEINEMLVGVAEWMQTYVDGEQGLNSKIQDKMAAVQQTCRELAKSTGLFS